MELIPFFIFYTGSKESQKLEVNDCWPISWFISLFFMQFNVMMSYSTKCNGLFVPIFSPVKFVLFFFKKLFHICVFFSSIPPLITLSYFLYACAFNLFLFSVTLMIFFTKVVVTTFCSHQNKVLSSSSWPTRFECCSDCW